MDENTIPEEFIKVIKDFVNDLKSTFPEYVPLINKWWKSEDHFNYIEEEKDRKKAFEKSQKKTHKLLFEFCQKKMPPRFFDILYQNEDIFKEDSDIDTEFLPNIHFKNLLQYDISDKTRETIWKYLQLILFSVVGTLENKEAFGDTSKLFEAINEDEFKSKLQDTLSQIQGLFDMNGNLNKNTDCDEGSEGGIDPTDLPDADKINEHISGMLDGKLGQFAKEIAQDSTSLFGIDINDTTDIKGAFNKLIKNPTKLLSFMKNIEGKLSSKLQSGELKESEILQEAMDITNKMKNMPGMGNIKSMLSKMGMDLGGLGKMNTGAMESQLNQRFKMAKTKERLRAKAEAAVKARADKESSIHIQQEQKPKVSDEELIQLFNSTEKVERTPRGSKPPQKNSNKKKKNKK